MATATPSWGVINPGKHPDTLTGRRGLFIGVRDRERMEVDFSKVAAETLAEFDDFLLSRFGIDPPFLRAYAFDLHALELLDACGPKAFDEDELQELQKASESANSFLDAVCSRCPDIPRRALISIGAAYREALVMETFPEHLFSITNLKSSMFHFGEATRMLIVTEKVPDEITRSARSAIGSAAAAARHAENRALKNEVFTWLDSNMGGFTSMDAAAEAIAGKVVPVKFRTARNWVGEWKKLQSAGTP